MKTPSILFVCLGNICRSPLAEGVFRDMAQKNGLSVEVDSAGTADYHVGHSPDERSVDVCAKHGIDIGALRGRQFTAADFDAFDYIYVMDKSNYSNVLLLARSEADKNKVDLLLNLSNPGRNMEVPDPYYGGPSGFDKVYDMVYDACQELIEKLNNER